MQKDIDLTVIHHVLHADGVGRHGLGAIYCLKDYLSLNSFNLTVKNYKDITPDIIKVLLTSPKGFGKVSLWMSILGLDKEFIPTHARLDSQVKMAYCMFESDRAPQHWVDILNKFYDVLVVPDEFMVGIFQKSGVKIPTVVVPLGIMVENLLEQPARTEPHDPFTFGMSAGFWRRKNHLKLLAAFKSKFGNDPRFRLKLHGRFGPYSKEVSDGVKEAGLNNLEFTKEPLSSEDYANFLAETDCLVVPSMGEGFSIPPREALALGIPAIVSDNTAHKTICKSGFVIPLPADKKIPAIYEVFKNAQIGNFYDCSADDLANLMKKTVDNYPKYLEQAIRGRAWAKQYLWSELRPLYMSLVKPQKVLFGKENKISPEGWTTNDAVLFSKLKGLL
jgi:glycosyltransferase involved in cell wall biosynthesis